jgi:hypothetical protein
LVDRLEYEQLNSLKPDWDAHATDLIALAEKVAESRSVLVIMSYADRPELEDAYATFRAVEKRIRAVVKSAVPTASPPIGPA